MGPVLFVGLTALALMSQGQGEVEFANPAVTMKEFSFAEPHADVTHTVLFAVPNEVSHIAPRPSLDPAMEVAVAQVLDESFATPLPSAMPRPQENPPETRQATQVADAPRLVFPKRDDRTERAATRPDRATAAAQGTARPIERPPMSPPRPGAQQQVPETGQQQAGLGAPDITLPSKVAATTPEGAAQRNRPAIEPGLKPDEIPASAKGVAEPSLDPDGPTNRFATHETWTVPGAPGAFSRIPRPGIGSGPQSARPDQMTVIADPTARQAIVDGDFVNLRTRPGSNGDTIAQFNQGEPALVTQTVGNWARVMIGGETGWMYLRYLRFE